jgi:AmmeMemoRadiSam system protein A
MSPLPREIRRALLELARRALVEAVTHRSELKLLPSDYPAAPPAGVFVSLHKRGRLRGCVGRVEATEPIAETVARCAAAAALEDPRFDPVESSEVAELEIELSVLSPLAPARPEEIVAGVHGILVSRGPQRGLLLPQVATQFRWDRERFLEETCHKAGLEREAWKDPVTQIYVFTAEVFSEAEFRGEEHAQAS